MTHPSNSKTASATAVIAQKLEQINVFAPATAESDAKLFARCGVVCMTTASNLVGQIVSRKGLDRRARTKAGEEALAFARMADLCMQRAEELA